MKIIISICCVLLFSVFSIQATKADERGGKKAVEETKKVDAKCYVSLINGSEAIIFWRVKVNKLSNLTNHVVGKKSATHKSLQKIEVYRAFQCILEGDNFTSLKAQSLDKKTPR